MTKLKRQDIKCYLDFKCYQPGNLHTLMIGYYIQLQLDNTNFIAQC